ncbi:MAG TPA: TIGR03084 family metal-binding protein [Acidimicrobiia bacterium]|nr:TIGR03084 family metal-binding protein [Acidimicrobiia bacterium]
MSTIAELLADLSAETEALMRLIEGLDSAGWEAITPAEPWTIRDQIGHLAYFDERAALAASDPDAFVEQVNRDIEALTGDVAELHRHRALDGPNTLGWWQKARADLIAAFARVDPEQRLPWYGPPMRARSSVVARLMETWAHGTDVADALGASLPVTDRLFHIADLGVRTFSWSFSNRGLEIPDQRVRVALRGPSGTIRVWNDEENASITGPVEDLCLVVTQRRNLADTHLVMEGGLARRWMEIAQVFAGPPGPGR